MRFWLAVAVLAPAIGGCGLPGSATGTASPGVAPAFSVQGLDGHAHTLGDYRGKVVVLNFWATWCIPCRAEMPDLEHEARVHRSDPVVVIGMDWQESAGPINDFVNPLGISYPILLDADGQAYKAYRVSALPTTFIIARDGRLLKSRLGIASRDELETEIKDAEKA